MSNLHDNPNNQRRSPRKECRTGAVIFCGAREFMSETRQVSRDGVLVSTPAPLTPGDRIKIQLVIGETQVEAEASVLYMLPGSKLQGTKIFGVRFDSISPEAQGIVDSFVTDDFRPDRKPQSA